MLSRRAAGTPLATRPSTWSFISAMRGETTSATPGVVADQGRHLEAQRLAAAGRQHHDAVAAFEHRVDRRALQGPQRLEPPVALEDVVDGRRQRLDGGSVLRSRDAYFASATESFILPIFAPGTSIDP